MKQEYCYQEGLVKPTLRILGRFEGAPFTAFIHKHSAFITAAELRPGSSRRRRHERQALADARRAPARPPPAGDGASMCEGRQRQPAPDTFAEHGRAREQRTDVACYVSSDTLSMVFEVSVDFATSPDVDRRRSAPDTGRADVGHDAPRTPPIKHPAFRRDQCLPAHTRRSTPQRPSTTPAL